MSTRMKALALASCFTTAFAATAYAQGAAPSRGLEPGMAIMIHPKTNKLHHVRVTPAHHAMLMQAAQKLPPGTIVYRSGDQLYLVQDPSKVDQSFYESNLPE